MNQEKLKSEWEKLIGKTFWIDNERKGILKLVELKYSILKYLTQAKIFLLKKKILFRIFIL